MRKFRRSNKSNDLKPIRAFTKDANAMLPPKKVIVATFAYQPASSDGPDFLGFQVGDYFQVVDRENDPDWYEVLDAKGKRGLVPVNHFEDVNKVDMRPRPSKDLHDSGYSDANGSPTPSLIGSAAAAEQARKQSGSVYNPSGRTSLMVYGIVLYDFVAERQDELHALAGEHVIIIAQSNPEWYVAKPITRLGGPGLIPATFVQLRNSSTNLPVEDAQEAIRAAGVPRVEEWKQRSMWYNSKSVLLAHSQEGIDGLDRLSISSSATARRSGASGVQSGTQSERNTLQAQSRLITPSFARVNGYTQDSAGEFCYRVEVVNEDGRAWALQRCYKDYYDLHIHLMEQFPEAAGKVQNVARTLPFLPGPLPQTTPELVTRRQPYMHDYIYRVLHIDQSITNSHPIRLFFSPRAHDEEIQPFDESEVQRLSTLSQVSISAQSSLYPAQRPRPQPSESRNGFEPPQILRNNSSMTTGSANGATAGATVFVKIKVFLGENCILLRLPSSFTFADLSAKVRERWLLEPGVDKIDDALALDIEYKEEESQTFHRLASDSDLRAAMEHNDKLTLRVAVSP